MKLTGVARGVVVLGVVVKLCVFPTVELLNIEVLFDPSTSKLMPQPPNLGNASRAFGYLVVIL